MTADKLRQIWRESTFELNDLISTVKFRTVDNSVTDLEVKVTENDDGDLRIVEIENREQGRCYALQLLNIISSKVRP